MISRRPRRPDQHIRGFTFVELLATMLFMAIVIPAAIQAISISNRAGNVANQKRIAAQLAEGLLNELIVTGNWRTAERQGDFGDAMPGYRWTLSENSWEKDTMREITLSVFFLVQQEEYAVSLTTLVEDTET